MRFLFMLFFIVSSSWAAYKINVSVQSISGECKVDTGDGSEDPTWKTGYGWGTTSMTSGSVFYKENVSPESGYTYNWTDTYLFSNSTQWSSTTLYLLSEGWEEDSTTFGSLSTIDDDVGYKVSGFTPTSYTRGSWNNIYVTADYGDNLSGYDTMESGEYWKVNYQLIWNYAIPDGDNLSFTLDSQTQYSLAAHFSYGDYVIDHYNIVVSTSSSFTSTLQDLDVSDNSSGIAITGLTPNTRYYAKIRAYRDDGSAGLWSTTLNAYTYPQTPSLSSPLSGTVTKDNTPTLDWADASGGADYYYYQIDNNSDFSTPIQADTVTSSVYTANTLSDGTYYWRVKTYGSLGYGDYSSSRSFTVDTTPPSVPTLSTPTNSTTVSDTIVTLSWDSSTGATGYTIIVDNNSDFSSPLIDTTTPSTSYTTSTLTRGETYYWKVRAYDNASNYSSYSSVYSFTINSFPSINTTTASVLENNTFVVNIDTTDVDGDNLTFTITGGADTSKFAITSAGVLSFITAPDYENPQDDGTNNTYEVEIQVDDNQAGTDTQTITITVADDTTSTDDTDGDGISDNIEYQNGLDTDGDGILNYKDIDSDGDNLLDGVEGIPNYLITNRAFMGAKTALNFDGSNYAKLNSANQVNLDGNFTISAWIKADTAQEIGDYPNIVTKYEQDNGYAVFLDMDHAEMLGTIRSSIRAGGTNHTLNGTTDIRDNKWHFFSVVYDGSDQIIYLDGKEENRATIGANALAGSSVGYLSFAATSSGSLFFKGAMDEIRIWNVARSASEIRDTMAKALDGNESGLVAYYPFDEISGDATEDKSTNANNATLVNSPTWISSDAFNTWVGNDNNYSNADNWSLKSTPDINDTVGIYSGAQNELNITSDISCNNLIIGKDSNIKVNANIHVNGSLILEDDLDATGSAQ